MCALLSERGCRRTFLSGWCAAAARLVCDRPPLLQNYTSLAQVYSRLVLTVQASRDPSFFVSELGGRPPCPGGPLLRLRCPPPPARFGINLTFIVLMAVVALFQPGDAATRCAPHGVGGQVAITRFLTLPPARPGISQTAFGAIVTFLFVMSASLPALPYATKLDVFFSAW